MKNLKFIEDGEIFGTRKTESGYLVGWVRCARTGIQIYSGDEVGKPEMDIVRVYRSPDEVFAVDSLKSFVGKPCTDNHPSELVNSDNWKEHSVGMIGEGVLREGQFVKVPIALMDGKIITHVEKGKREISMGYLMDLKFQSGETPEGEQYDAIQTNLRMNHLAIVERGRAGSECRVGDGEQWAKSPSPNLETKPKMSDKLQTVMVDGLSVTTTEAGVQAITRLEKDKANLESKNSEMAKSHKAEIEAKDKELATKDGEIEKLKKATPDQKAIDAQIQERSELLTKAGKLAKDADFTGKSDSEVRRIAVEAVRGEDSMKDKSEAYVEVAFDVALEASDSDDKGGNPDPVREALISRDNRRQDDGDGQDEYEGRISDAWKSEEAA